MVIAGKYHMLRHQNNAVGTYRFQFPLSGLVHSLQNIFSFAVQSYLLNRRAGAGWFGGCGAGRSQEILVSGIAVEQKREIQISQNTSPCGSVKAVRNRFHLLTF